MSGDEEEAEKLISVFLSSRWDGNRIFTRRRNERKKEEPAVGYLMSSVDF